MSCANVIINHDNCSHDANCGLTCDGIVQRELATNPDFSITSEFYDEFIASCYQFYWPNGCSVFSSSSDMGYLQAVAYSNEVLSYVVIGFVFILCFVLGFNVGSR